MPSRDAFQIGPLVVHWYGIMIMLGVVVASVIAYLEAKRRREDPDNVWQMFPWVLVAGIVGARVGFVIAELGTPTYQDPANWFKIWEGGLSIQGAVVGGVIAVILFCRYYHLSFFKWADIIVPGLALGQAIGRWGNFFNQEAFGGKTDLPWGIPISVEQQRAVGGPNFPVDPNARFHPTFAYEMIWDLINFGLLMWLGRQKRFRMLEGDLLWVYLIVYSIGRFVIEGIRVDSATIADFKTPQVVALLTIVIAWFMIIYRHRPGAKARPSVQGPSPVRHVRLSDEGTYSSTSAAPSRSDQPSRIRKVPTSVLASRQVADQEASTTLASTQPGAAGPASESSQAG